MQDARPQVGRQHVERKTTSRCMSYDATRVSGALSAAWKSQKREKDAPADAEVVGTGSPRLDVNSQC